MASSIISKDERIETDQFIEHFPKSNDDESDDLSDEDIFINNKQTENEQNDNEEESGTDDWSHSSSLSNMVWWQRYHNLAWLPNGERRTSDCLLLSINDQEQNLSQNEEDEYSNNGEFDTTECFILCCPFLSVVNLIRLMKTCYFLNRNVPKASMLKSINFQKYLSNINKLANTPSKLRAEIFRSRVRQKDWGKYAPVRIKENKSEGNNEGSLYSKEDYIQLTINRFVENFNNLEEINLKSVELLSNLSVEAICIHLNSSLTILHLDRTKINKLSEYFNKCHKLEILTLRRCPFINDISPISSCISLIKCDFAYLRITRVNGLQSCLNLKHLDLSHSTISDLQGTILLSLFNLYILPLFFFFFLLMYVYFLFISFLHHALTSSYFLLFSCFFVSNTYKGLESLSQLTYLDLTCTSTMDIYPLAGCVSLKHLSLASTNVVALSSLRSCSSLTYLNLKQAPIKYLDALLHCSALSRLILCDTQIENVNSLKKCFLLKYIDISRTSCDDSEVVSVLLLACPLLEMLIGSKGKDLLPLLQNKEKAYRKHALGSFLKAASVFRHVQSRFRIKLNLRRLEEAKALEEATILARAVGNVDAFGNVIVDNTLDE